MPTISFIDLFLLMGVGQGIFLLVSLKFIDNKNITANKALSLIILAAVLMICGRLFMYSFHGNWTVRLSFLADNTIFLLGPFIYNYTRRLFFNDCDQHQLRWTHFIPSLLHLLYFCTTFSYSIAELHEMYVQGQLTAVFATVEFLGLTSLSFYLFRSFVIARRYQDSQHDTSGKGKTMKVLFFLGCILFLLTLGWSFSFISIYLFNQSIPFINYETIWISISFLLYGIGYFGIRQPEILRLPYPEETKSKPQARMKPKERDLLKSKLDSLLINEKPYLQPDLTLSKLANNLNTTNNNLSWLLNHSYGKSFHELVNTSRLEEFVSKVERQEHEELTLLAIAMDVGFNSKSAFNRAFKNKYGITPRQYAKEVRDQLNNVP